jgi:2-amino-4-hydroxy-6-hydroxymethyldihydropteridine diphosphokinase
MNHVVYLALGTNLGDRRLNLRAAMDALPPEVKILAESKIYETPPWGVEDQPAFLNMAVKAKTGLMPPALLAHLKRLEADLGRRQTFRWGPRLIDIDILFYDDLVFESEELVIPHPRLHERAFVLVPLADLAPDLVHPALGKAVRELLNGLDRTGITLFAES